jgi:inorganic pyrophosphatase
MTKRSARSASTRCCRKGARFLTCLLSARPLGVIEAEQRERNGEVERNDRLLAVATKARTHAHVHRLEDLRPGLLEEIEAFFGHYNALSGKDFKPVARGGPDRARALVQAGIAAAEEKKSG